MHPRAAIFAVSLGLLWLLAGRGSAAPARAVAPIRPIPPVGPSPITADCRYLFVVDTSAAMQRYADGLYRTVHRHIATGLGGRMQEGDIFTVWTYADAVLTREFPLNAWTADLNIALANRTYEYLAARKFAGKSNLRPVFAELGQALAISTNLTLILISDGTDVVVGTPFDRPINVIYGKRASELRAAKMPFVTALVTQAGEFTHWSVRGGVEDINLPLPVRNPFPMPVPALAQVPPQPTPAPVPSPPPPAPVIVVPPPPAPAPVATVTPPTNSPPPKPAPTPAPTPAPAALAVPPPKAPTPTPPQPPSVVANTHRHTAPVPAVKPSDVPPPTPAPVATPAPKPVTNVVAVVSPVPKAPAPPAPVKPPAPPPTPPTETKASPVPKPTPTPVPVPPKAPTLIPPAPTTTAQPSVQPAPPPAVTNAAKVAAATPPPKPALVPEPKPAPAPVITPKETLILPALPLPPLPVVPPARRQPKSLTDTSNTLAKIELLRPPSVASTAAPPARPLEARVPAPAPAPKTTPPPPPIPAAKPTTNAAVTPPPQPKAVAVPIPPAPVIPAITNVLKQPANTSSNSTIRPPARESVSKVSTNPPTPVVVTHRMVTTNTAPAATRPPVQAEGTGKGKSSAATNAPAIAAPKPVASAAVKASPATNQPAKPKGALAVASPRAQTGGWVYLGAAVGLLLLAGVIIAYLLRPQPHPSAISQSIDSHPGFPRE